VTEPVVQLTIDIAAPAEVVFDILTNPAQHPEIDGSTTVRRLLRGPRRLSAGSRFSMSMRLFGVPYRVTNRVVEFESNRLIAWRHFEPQRWRYELGTRHRRYTGEGVIRLLHLPHDRPVDHQARRVAGTQPACDRSDPAAAEGCRPGSDRQLIPCVSALGRGLAKPITRRLPARTVVCPRYRLTRDIRSGRRL
jgi:hypothetical protein